MGKLLVIFLMFAGCISSKTNIESSKSLIVQQNEIDSITVVAISRGFYEKLKITEDSIYFEKKRPDFKQNIAITKEEWKTLNSLMDSIPIDDISKIEPPSTHYQFDGSAMTNIAVYKKMEEVKSQTFDKDNPPKRFKESLNFISKLKNTYLDH